MEYTIEDDFEPLSSIHGNIEISFNSKISELDPYEPVKEQLDEFVIALGKTGRANRLTVKVEEVNSDDLKNLSEDIAKIANEIERIERLIKSTDESEPLSDQAKTVLDNIPKTDEIKVDELFEKTKVKNDDILNGLDELSAKGKIYSPNKDVVHRI